MDKPVLLIEDNEQNRYLTTFLLEKSGYRVVTAIDGLSGIEMAKAVLPGLILLDIQLPRLDGYQVARLLRQDAGLRNVPIIAVTSYAMRGDREAALASGCDGYIEKPIDPDTFVSQIRTYLHSEGT
jgi:two-component system cell cycle response regulator DivK